MASHVSQFLRVSWPVLGALVALTLNLAADEIAVRGVELTVPLPQVSAHLTLHGRLMVHVILAVVAICLIGLVYFRDYSTFVGDFWLLDVTFDEDSITTALAGLTPTERRSLKIDPRWRETRRHVLDELDRQLIHVKPSCRFRFSGADDLVRASGDVRFKVEKVSTLGHAYRVVKSAGILEHVCQVRNGPAYRLKTRFELIPSENDYVSLSLVDVYLRHAAVIHPQFKQVMTSDDDEVCQAVIVAATKFRFFPLFVIGPTIHLYQGGARGELVPLSIARNTPD